MNTKIIKNAWLLLTLFLGVCSANAQLLTRMTVQKSGATQSYTMYDSGKMYFSASLLVIDTLGDGNTVSVDLEQIDKLLFSTFELSSSGDVVIVNDASALAVVPTLASEQITISGISADFKYQIIDFSGRVLLQGMAAAGEAIDISSLRKGVYLIKVNGSILKFSRL